MPKETGDDLTELRPCATNNGHCGSWRDAPKGLLSNFATVRAKLLSGFAAEKARALLDTVMRGRIAFRPIGKDRYELTVPIAFDRVVTAAIPKLRGLQDMVTSPTGVTRFSFTLPKMPEIRRKLRPAA